MNKRTGWFRIVSAVVILGALLLAACGPRARVGPLRTETQSVELGDAKAVRVEVNFGAGELQVSGGAQKLLEAGFTYNVARLKPQVEYREGALAVRQPEDKGLPVLRDLEDFRNEWDLRLNDQVPMDLRMNVGAGTGDLRLAGLSLTGLAITVGAGDYTIDLSGGWTNDLDVTIESGAADIRLRLPGQVGARVEVDAGASFVEAPDLAKDGNVYTNAAYGDSEVTLDVSMQAGIGRIRLEVDETAAAPPDYASLSGALSPLVQAAVDEAGVTGLSVALVDDQEIVWSEGFGYADKEKGVKATPETVYGVASISKLFTASAVMQLADQGKIDIDQPLQTYLPGFSIHNRFPGAGSVTPRGLLTHHAGLPSDWTNGMFVYGDDSEALDALTRGEFHNNLVEDVQQAYVTNPPNTGFSYSNLSYALLGRAVEEVTGQDFIDYMDEALLQPLGMASSSFTVRPNMYSRLSKEYWKGEAQDYVWSRDIPAAALHTSVEDLSRFMMMVFGAGELRGQRILRAETVTEMLRPQNDNVPLDFEARWGLGWWLLPVGLEYAGVNAWHSGGEGRWDSLLLTLPDHELGVVVLNNSAAEAGNINFQIATAILEQALKIKAGLERPAAEPPQIVSLSAEERLSYEGLYTTDIGWMNIRSAGTDLVAEVGGATYKLLPHGAGYFSIEGVPYSEAQLAIKAVNGRTALYFYGLNFGGLTYGERLAPARISQAWQDRVGRYEVTNGKPGFLTFLEAVELKVENDFLLLNAKRSDTGEQFSFPLGALSDEEAVILGVGLRGRGEAISAVEVDGEEQLFYSGYLLRRVSGAAEQPSQEGAVYEDPQGRFSLPLVGAWKQLETDGSYALFEVTGFDLKVSVHSIESEDLMASQEAALHQAGIDPATLTKADEAKMGGWNLTFYSQGKGRGVTPLCQVADQVTYCLIFTGEEDLTNNPPEHVFKTFEGFSITGKEIDLPTTIEDFEAYVNSFVGDYPPGLTILITRGGEILYSKAFGMADGPKGMPAEPDTVYMWGSMTKVATASAVMQLVDQGLVDLDAPVSDYLEYFPAEYGITVRQLLGHSSGLDAPVEFDIANLNLDGQPLTDPDRAAREFLEGLSKLMFEPGSSAFYSNPGFVMLGQIVAEVSGQPFVEYVRENILRPLGMVNTDFAYSNQTMITKAAGHAFRTADVENFIPMIDQVKGPVSGAELIREVDDRFAWMTRYNVMAANGGLIGPATEAVRFAQMHLNGGELDGVRILSPEAVALMQEMQLTTSGGPLGYGLAWRVFDEAEHPFVEHDGGGTGLWAKMRLYPQARLAILLMSNASG